MFKFRRSTTSATVERDPFERAQKAMEVANTTADAVHNLYLAFLLLGVYIGIMIVGTVDEQLLRVSPIMLPILEVELPIVGFYTFTPWLLVLVHLNFLLQYLLLGQKLRWFNECTRDLADVETAAFQRQLANFPLAHLLSGPQHDRFMRGILTLMSWVTVIILPLGLLLGIQIRFLPYHDSDITWGQRAAVLVDVLILMLCWPRIVGGKGWWEPSLHRLYTLLLWLLAWFWAIMGLVGRRRWVSPPGREFRYCGSVTTGGGVGFLSITALIAAFLSLCVATVPGEWWEKEVLLPYLPEGWKKNATDGSGREFFWLTYILFEAKIATGEKPVRPSSAESSTQINAPLFHRNLDLGEKLLTENNPPAKAINILRENKAEQTERALQEILGINLRQRDLRYAYLAGVILSKADLREANLQGANLMWAQLQGANLERAQLQGANLGEAQLQGADLGRAWLQGAGLWGAQLQGAGLWGAQLQGAGLWGAQLQGADLEGAQLQGADLEGAQLQGADLEGAQLQGADLEGARLQGADLEEARLQGVDLGNAQLQGADLEKAQLQGADLRMAQLQGADLRRTQFQGANLEGARLQGANLSKAAIGGALFNTANVDFADLRGLNRTVLTQEDYEALQHELKRQITNASIRGTILRQLAAAIEREDTLKEVASHKQCLSDQPKLLPNCFTEDHLTEYRSALVTYLLQELACSNSTNALRVVNRAYWKNESDLAKALLAADCTPVKKLLKQERLKEGLKRVLGLSQSALRNYSIYH